MVSGSGGGEELGRCRDAMWMDQLGTGLWLEVNYTV